MESINVNLFGRDSRVLKNLKFVEHIASTKAPALITGELGVGKRTMAQYLHSLSNRKDRPYAVIDCSADPKEVEDKILGYHDPESGRFIKGALESTNGGTVTLAHIDGLPEDFQGRLIQIFDELSDYDIDLCILATTTRNLSKMLGLGKFHRGLYAYFANTQISMISLRDRVGDIQFLSQELLKILSEEKNCMVPGVEEKVNEKLFSHCWTHNVGEMIEVMKETFDRSNKSIITLDNLALGDRRVLQGLSGSDGDGLKLMSLKDAEKLLIKKALLHTSENRTQAAKILGVSIRTLRNKINEYRDEGSQFFLNLR